MRVHLQLSLSLWRCEVQIPTVLWIQALEGLLDLRDFISPPNTGTHLHACAPKHRRILANLLASAKSSATVRRLSWHKVVKVHQPLL